MGTDEQLLDALLKLKQQSASFMLAKIKDVDTDNYTVTATIDDDFELYNVRLKSVVDDVQHSIIQVPKAGSTVILGVLNKSDFFVAKISEVESIQMSFKGGLSVVLDSDGVVMNGGDNGGLIMIDKLLAKINRLEDKLKTHQHLYIPYPGGVPGLPVPSTKHPGNVFINTTKKDIEDKKITH